MAMMNPTSGQAQSWPSALPPFESLTPPPHSPPPALAVPYLPQSVLLCGGAALAMVERWWGRRGVQAEEFSALVQPELGGIRTSALDSASRARGWQTRAVRGTAELTRRLLSEGVPVIALIAVGRDQYHFVVVLGWQQGEVVYHDPAGSPSTTRREASFLAQWAGGGHWALIVQPMPPAPLAPATVSPPLPAPPAVVVDSLPCRPWLDQALDAVAANQLEEAARLLTEAVSACPTEPLVQRELAGVRFKQGRHAEASGLATEYLTRAPEDELGWQILASSRYLAGDDVGALQAWNMIGRPVVDLLVINGSRRVRFRPLSSAVAVPHGTILTPSRLALARRRLAEVPALRQAHVGFQPVSGGLIEVRATVAERPITEPVWRLVAAGTIGALAQQVAQFDVASPTGAGELWTVAARWEEARPRVSLRVRLPVHLGIPSVVEVGGAWQRSRLALDPAGSTIAVDSWRSGHFGLGAWLTAAVRTSATVGLERWSGNRDYQTVAAGAEFWALDDRFLVRASAKEATALADHPSYRRGGVQAMWASSLGLARPAWSARLGGDWVSAAAPLGAWPVAGSSLSRDIPLRAEPSPRAGFLAGRAAGRGILHAGLSGDVPVHRMGPLLLAAGVFLDGAQIGVSVDATARDRTYLDGGVGLRFALAGGALGVVRIDWARGLIAGQRSALTFGFHRTWPFFPPTSR